MTDRRIDFEWLSETASGNAVGGLIDAIDLASDQGQTTWITIAGSGKRLAKIAPVDEIPDDFLSSRLAVKRQETEPAWAASRLPSLNPGARDTLLQVMARQIEEIHRTLGLERDEEGDLVQAAEYQWTPDEPGPSRILRDQIRERAFAAMDSRDEAETRLAADGMLLISRDLLLRVLRDEGLVFGARKGEAVWQALHGGYENRSSDQSEKAVPSQLPADNGKYAPGAPLTGQIVLDVLSLAGVTVSYDESVRHWTSDQRAGAYDWAIREHLHASDNDVARVPEPAFVTEARVS